MKRALKNYILYENNRPTHVFDQLSVVDNYVSKMANNTNISVHKLVYYINGVCVDDNTYIYNKQMKKLIKKNDVIINNTTNSIYDKRQKIKSNQDKLSQSNLNQDNQDNFNQDNQYNQDNQDIQDNNQDNLNQDNLNQEDLNQEYFNKMNQEDLKQEEKQIDIMLEKSKRELDKIYNNGTEEDEDFKKRCEEQEKRNNKRKEEEKISVMISDKNTYLMMKGRVIKGTLKERNISPIFHCKYVILKYMEDNELVSFTTNDNIINETTIFHELYKIVIELEKMDDLDKPESILDNVDEDYLDTSFRFLEYLVKLIDDGVLLLSDKRVHDMLNNDPEMKSGIFRESINQSIFTKDCDKSEYADN